MERVFQAIHAKALKINYKGGYTYKVKHPILISVYETIGGGHNVEYTYNTDGVVHDHREGYDYQNLKNVVTKDEDVVSIELWDALLTHDNVHIDYLKQTFIKGH